MSTAAQQQANKQNAQHSTGPRTAQGKQRSRLNALKHGFRAKDPLIPGESLDSFYEHGAKFEIHLCPANPVEADLVEQIIDITWRLRRCGRIQSAFITELFDSTAEQPENQDADRDRLLGKALIPDNRLAALNRLDRHEASLARRYHNVMKELREARKRRAQSALFTGFYANLRPKPPAGPPAESNTETDADHDRAAAANGPSEMPEPIQSVVSLLESIAPMNSPTGEPDLSDLTPAEFYRMYPETSGQDSHQAATK